LSLTASDPAATCCEGFVLAGGQSSRMGQDKSLVRFRGVPLIQHALQILRAAGIEARIAGARADLSSFAPAIPDDPAFSGLGPLSGICPAMGAASARFVVFIPVDLPLVPHELIRYLVHHARTTESAVTLASICGFVETFPVVIDSEAAPLLYQSLRSDDRKSLNAFRAAADALSRPFSVVPVEFLIQAGQIHDPHGLPPNAWFLSLNTPEDLHAAEALLGPITAP
jgi:molybdenum cofactor guanylyltransferase